MIGALRMRLFIVLLVPVVLAAVVACIASFNALQASYGTLLGERFAEVAENLANVAEDMDRIGQLLAAQSRLQQLIEQAKSQNNDVSGISVMLDDGRVVFDTDLAAIGERIPAAWLPRPQLGLVPWIHADRDNLVVGSPVVNSFRRPVGAVIVRVSATVLALHKVSSFRAVALVGLGFLALTAVACYAAALQLARQIAPPVQRATGEIDQATELMRGGEASAPPRIGPAVDEAEIVSRVRAVAGPLNMAERAFTQLDDAA